MNNTNLQIKYTINSIVFPFVLMWKDYAYTPVYLLFYGIIVTNNVFVMKYTF